MACLGLQSTSAGICSESLHGQDTRPYIRVASRDDDRRVQVLVVYYGDKKETKNVAFVSRRSARRVSRMHASGFCDCGAGHVYTTTSFYLSSA